MKTYMQFHVQNCVLCIRFLTCLVTNRLFQQWFNDFNSQYACYFAKNLKGLWSHAILVSQKLLYTVSQTQSKSHVPGRLNISKGLVTLIKFHVSSPQFSLKNRETEICQSLKISHNHSSPKPFQQTNCFMHLQLTVLSVTTCQYIY
jgi:hypothetical protein